METIIKSSIKFLLLIPLLFALIACDEVEEIFEDDEEEIPTQTQAFVPEDVSGLMMWLDASDSTTLWQDDGCSLTPAATTSDPIGCWADKSGQGHHATQSIVAKKPELDVDALNQLDAIYFADDAAQAMDLASAQWQPNKEFSAFIIYYQDVTDAASALFSTYPGAVEDFMLASRPTAGSTKNKYYDFNVWKYSSNYTAGDWNIDSFNRQDTDMIYSLDGSLDSSFSSLRNASPAAATIGSYTNGGASFKGHIAEIIWYGRSVSEAEQDKIEGFLAHKWDIAHQLPSDHPYKNTAPTTTTSTE